LNRPDLVAKSIYDISRESDLVLIVVSGDVAFSGKKNEYDYSDSYLTCIKENIQKDCDVDVDFIIAPGNHDCNFDDSDSIRDIIIDSVISDPNKARDYSVIEKCTSVQRNFFDFREKLTDKKPVFDSSLWTSYVHEIGDDNYIFSVINVAWMSRISEVQGDLVFPTETYPEVLDEYDGIKVAIIHHPLNWYTQETYHPFRKMLREKFDVLISGHEHIPTSSDVVSSSNRSLVFEAAALNPHEDVDSGYSSIHISAKARKIFERKFLLNGLEIKVVDENEFDFDDISGRNENKKLKASFIETITDAGGPFTHPDKSEIFANDIFIFPELERKIDGPKETMDSSKLVPVKGVEKKILILGEEKSGKTFLFQKYFIYAHENGLAPLFVRSGDIKSQNEAGFKKAISSAAARQYIDVGEFEGSSLEDRVLFLDDIDGLRGGAKNKYKLLSFLDRQFGSIYLSGSEDIELSELVDMDAAKALEDFDSYSIKSFGHRMRHKLIKNWCLCGSIETNKQLDQRVHGIETLLNTVIGKNLVPPRPLYLLILLQSCDSNNEGDLESSGFAYYYQYLITKSLKEHGVRNTELNEIFNYLSQLAWFFKNEGVDEVDVDKLRLFNQAFCKKYTTVDFDSRIKLLVHSKILSNFGKSYFFQYPYIYYFFLGNYLAVNISDSEVRDLVLSCCRTLNSRECASTILFLSHHVSDTWLVDQIMTSLNQSFGDSTPIMLGKDVESLNSLVDSSIELIISDINVPEAQEQQRQVADHVEDNEQDGTEDGPEEVKEIVAELQHLLKTSEILGQIIKNYYGSLEREKKKDCLKEVFEGPLRMLRFIFDKLLRDPQLFVKELETTLEERGEGKSSADREAIARKVAFNIIGMICTGVVLKTGQFVASDKLNEEISELVLENPSNSFDLIEAASRLSRPGALQVPKLTKLSKSLEKNNFAFTVFQSLIVYYLHMFHTSEKEKQQLCQIAKIKLSAARSIGYGKGLEKNS
ncbi:MULTISPECIES: metallophosphoesterase, partial [unclassified Marinobacter]